MAYSSRTIDIETVDLDKNTILASTVSTIQWTGRKIYKYFKTENNSYTSRTQLKSYWKKLKSSSTDFCSDTIQCGLPIRKLCKKHITTQNILSKCTKVFAEKKAIVQRLIYIIQQKNKPNHKGKEKL